MKKTLFQRGYTLIEIIVVGAILSILLGLTTVNLLSTKQHTSFNTSLGQLTSDIKSQQIKAIQLVSNPSGVTSDYGVHFESNSYTFFTGAYSPGNSNNLIISLGDNIEFSSILLPNSSIIFQRKSGEVSAFDPNMDTITVKDTTTNQQKTITINRYGVITSVN